MIERRMDLALTLERMTLEGEAVLMLREWLKARIQDLLEKHIGNLDLSKGTWSPWNVFDPGRRYGDRKASIKAGEEIFEQIITRGRDLGAQEAALALLKDPPRTYKDYTIEKLKQLATQQVALVDRHTKRLLRRITSQGEPDNVQELIHKIYSISRCQGIASDQVAKGYVRGAAEVLRQNGYRYIYVRTELDSKVCTDCQKYEGEPMTIMKFIKRYPRHPRCRCYPSTTRADGTRDPALHSKSILIDWEQKARTKCMMTK